MDAEAYYHFQDLFHFFVLVYIKENRHTLAHAKWTLCGAFHNHPNPIEQRPDIYFCTPNMKILSTIYKKYTYNAHHSNIILIWDWLELIQ